HPELVSKDAEDSPFSYNNDGSINDGDDHEWTGDQDVLRGGGGWCELLGKRCILNEDMPENKSAGPSQLKQQRTNNSEFVDLTTDIIDFTHSSPVPQATDNVPIVASPLRSSSPIQYGSGDEQELDEFMEQIKEKADAFKEAAAILRTQLQYKNQIWMKTLSHRKFGCDVMHFIDDIQLYEETGRKHETTWVEGKSKSEKHQAKFTMGYM
ncbi:hypothetical protein C0995_006664, partial [Termitomyces sp. Mi166